MPLTQSPLPFLKPKIRIAMASVQDWLLCEGRNQSGICGLLEELAHLFSQKGLPLSLPPFNSPRSPKVGGFFRELSGNGEGSGGLV